MLSGRNIDTIKSDMKRTPIERETREITNDSTMFSKQLLPGIKSQKLIQKNAEFFRGFTPVASSNNLDTNQKD